MDASLRSLGLCVLLFVAGAVPACSSPSSQAADAGPSQQAEDLAVVDTLWRIIGVLATSGSWYSVGAVSASGACEGGSYGVTGQITQSGPGYDVNLTFDLSGCAASGPQQTFAYTGRVIESGSFQGSGADQTARMALSSSDLTVTGTYESAALDGYSHCSANVTGPAGVAYSGTLCGRTIDDQPGP
jgi:hypothetical protein